MTGASKNTIVKLLDDAGRHSAEYQDKKLRGLTCKRVQVDEIWSFVYCQGKERGDGQDGPAAGRQHVDVDGDRCRYQADPVLLVGGRDAYAAQRVHRRPVDGLANRVQLT